MKKLLFIILLSFCLFICSCAKPFNNDYFLPSKGKNLHQERFEKKFDEILSSNENEVEYEVLGNYVPAEKSKLYDFDAFIVKIENFYNFYVWYKNNIYCVSEIPVNEKSDVSFVHFAVTDINNDGYKEIMTSINFNQNSEKNPHSISYVSIIDEKTEKQVFLNTIYNGFAYFKKDKTGVLGVYTSDEEIINNGKYNTSNTLVCTLVKNDYQFSYKENAYEVLSDNYKVIVNIEEDDFYFPVLSNSGIGFDVNVIMTYLGETFSYTNGSGYLDGATCTFVYDDKKIMCEGWGETGIIREFEVYTGMVIDRTYKYPQSLDKQFDEGTYDMVITYRGETVIIEDFLTISKSK